MAVPEHELPTKAALRTRARAARQGLSPGEREHQSLIVAEKVLALPRVQAAGLVLAYCAKHDELSTLHIVRSLAERGVRIALPRVSGPASLTLHYCQGPANLEEGSYGILEPREDSPEAERTAIEVILVPGVAFDDKCHRLGYGRGFYDRLLPGLPHAMWLGLAFDAQIVEKIPAEEHDVVLDAVVTPSRTYSEAGH